MMSERINTKQQVEAKPLETRHAFLDTQVYRKLKHNPANRALQVLSGHIDGHRIVLHITDITLSEIERQIGEEVELARAALAKAGKDVARWRHTVPSIGPMPELRQETAGQLSAAFRTAAMTTWRAKAHSATSQPAAPVFADYFGRKAPFDRVGSKEFPDAFVLHALEAWCALENELMYVVTQDAAMKRAAEQFEHLVTLDTIEELLGAASASAEGNDEHGSDEEIADAILNAPEFDYRFEQVIEAQVENLILIYEGDLPEGEVTGATFGGVISSFDFNIVSRTNGRLGLLVNADVEVEVAIAYEDRDLAMFDREDDVWIGAEWATTSVIDNVTVELYIELEISTGLIAKSELIRTEYRIH